LFLTFVFVVFVLFCSSHHRRQPWILPRIPPPPPTPLHRHPSISQSICLLDCPHHHSIFTFLFSFLIFIIISKLNSQPCPCPASVLYQFVHKAITASPWSPCSRQQSQSPATPWSTHKLLPINKPRQHQKLNQLPINPKIITLCPQTSRLQHHALPSPIPKSLNHHPHHHKPNPQTTTASPWLLNQSIPLPFPARNH
jgi:hypothetical protein